MDKAYIRMHRAIVNWPELGPRDSHCKLVTPWGATAARTFINEVTGWLLAKSAGLPLPPAAGFTYVPGNALLALYPDDAWDANTRYVAWCTATQPGKPLRGIMQRPVTATDARDLLQWDDFSRAAAFDGWVANVDRNAGNLLRNGPGDYTLIDHDCICTSDDWLPDLLLAGQDDAFRNLLLELATECLDTAPRHPTPFHSAMMGAANMQESVLQSAISQLLHLWPQLEHDEPVRDALRQFLTHRAQHATQHMQRTTGHLL